MLLNKRKGWHLLNPTRYGLGREQAQPTRSGEDVKKQIAWTLVAVLMSAACGGDLEVR